MPAQSDTTKETLVVVDAPLAGLRAHPRNPRTIRPDRLEQLKRALTADPDMLRARPLVALPDGTVIAGNQRLRAAVDLGWDTIPVLFADLDDARATEWMLRDNRPYGEDDEELTGLLLAELGAGGRDLDLTGFASADVDRLLAAVRAEDPVDPDEVPALPAEPRSKLGEVYELGPHRLMCGDATDEANVDSLLDGEEVRLVLADPPYNVDYRGGTHDANGTIKRERTDAYHDRFDDYTGWLTSVLSNAHAASDARAALMLWHSPSQMRAVLAAVDVAGWTDRSLIVWNKGNIMGGIGQTSKQYRTQFEPLLHCHKRGKTPRWFGPTNESDVWDVTGPRANPLHPTMKPVVLYERSLANHSRRGDVVLECFGGSGTTIIAAEITGRRCFAMEIEPAYCDVIRQRYADFTGQPHLAP